MKIPPDELADCLVVGNGIAGCVATIELRQYLPQAKIMLVSEQCHPTINTPALKQFGAGKLALEQLLAYPPGAMSQLGLQLVQRRVERLDTAARIARFSDGRALAYKRLLLATGSLPSGLPESCPGRGFDGVLTLHRLTDYLDLRRRLPQVSRAIVIGGGYHAAETVLLLRHCGVRVTWLIRGRGLAAQLLDATASDLLVEEIRRRGVDVRPETEIAGVVGRIGVVAGVVTTVDTFIRAELVVVCTGVRPATELLAGMLPEAELASGVAVDGALRTSIPGVWAAGDVAAVRDPQSGRCGPRAQWYFATQQGRMVSASMAGRPLPAEVATTAMGAFWHTTQLGELSVTVVGAPALAEHSSTEYEVVTTGSKRFYRRLVLRRGGLVGYVAVGPSPLNGLPIKRLIDKQADVRDLRGDLLGETPDLNSVLTASRLRAIRSNVASVAV